MNLSITGLGVLSVCGFGTEVIKAAIARDERLDTLPLRTLLSFPVADGTDRPNVAEVPDFNAATYLGDKGLRSLDRLTKLMVVAARTALESARLKQDGALCHYAHDAVGVVTSNAYGSLEAITELDRVAELEDARYINPSKFPNTVANSASGYVSIWEELRALNVAVSGGNTGALDAMACADMYLTAERASAIVVGGAEAMSEALYMAFHKLRAPGTPARLAEGAAFFVVEPQSLAAARGAVEYARICGYGTAFIPHDDAILLHGSQAALERAMAQALTEAQVDATAVRLVVTSIANNQVFDGAEYAALRNVLPQVPQLHAKLLLGETLGASGALAIVAAIAAHRNRTPSEPRAAGAKYVMVTALGYYGNASALLLRMPGVGDVR
jgi:3-oxoacyl-[acyl-carrier-protein] synthase II